MGKPKRYTAVIKNGKPTGQVRQTNKKKPGLLMGLIKGKPKK